MKILFVRHGKTDWNNEKKMQGGVDIALNAEGITHAEEVAKTLANEKIDIAFCSPLMRAKETFDIINKFRKDKIPVIYNEALSERDYGLYEARNKKLFNYDLMWDYSNPLNIDSFFEFAWPIIEFIYSTLLRAYKDKTVLIVSHGGVSKIFEMILSKNSLSPEDLASYLPNNSEITIYQNNNDSDFVYNILDNIEPKVQDKLFEIITPNRISLFLPSLHQKDLMDANKISQIPNIRYRACIIFERDDGKIATEVYSNTKEYKLPARTIDSKRKILHQVREILLQMTGYLGDIKDFYNLGETIEIRPSDPIAEIVYTEVYYISQAKLVSEPLPDYKDEQEGFNLEFYSKNELRKLIAQALQDSTSIQGEFYRPLITKKSIALREKLI
ncbi:MAG: histidine phosphatase family protein, partial [Bacilli bacterium]|nr:histidine phosphatase family protein [Bacilli bacterium]